MQLLRLIQVLVVTVRPCSLSSPLMSQLDSTVCLERCNSTADCEEKENKQERGLKTQGRRPCKERKEKKNPKYGVGMLFCGLLSLRNPQKGVK